MRCLNSVGKIGYQSEQVAEALRCVLKKSQFDVDKTFYSSKKRKMNMNN